MAILACCGLLLAASLSSAATGEPKVRVVRAASPPVVDGQDSDAAWKTAISVVDFIVPGSHRPLEEKTEVRLLRDNDNLYVFARLNESILSVAGQMQSEIKTAAKNRDDAVIDDDSFLLILRPEGSKSAWEFGVNTRGVLADGKSDPADLWESRDYSWNGQIQATALMDDGFWTVEMAIPWKELGMTAPADGTQMQTIIGRHAAARRASGSWNPSGKGIHDPGSWGQLVFGEPLAGVQPTPLLSLESGKNELKLLLAPPADGKASLLVGTKITPGQKGARPVRSRETVGISGKDAKTFTHDFKVDPSGGEVDFSWSLSDSASLAPLYQSPEIAMEILSSSVTLQISASAPWRLLVNDAEVASGQATSDQSVKIALRTGANLLALETQSGTARLGLDSPDLGETTKRHPILGLRMGNRQQSVALVGAIHAGESGPELIVSVLEKFLENDSDLLKQCGIVALPTVNIDERERQVEGVPWYLRTNANGVDLNRNFPADWETVESGYGLVSSDPDAITYRGPYAASESETQAVMSFLESTRPQAVFSFHCLAGICSPPFLTSRFSEEDEPFVEKCQNLAASYTHGCYGDEREPQINYGTSAGSLPHWMYHNGAVPSFDLEWDGDERTRACLTDQTTPEMIEECAERHYCGIRAVLESLSKIGVDGSNFPLFFDS